MSQPDTITVPTSGLDVTPEGMAQDMNDSFLALANMHKGASRPAYAVAGTMWLSDATTPWVVNLYDGSTDIPLALVNPTTHKAQMIADRRAVVIATKTSDQSIASNTFTKITYDTENYDADGFLSSASNRFIPPAGIYRISACAYLLGTNIAAGELIFAAITKNGAAANYRYFRGQAGLSMSVFSDGLMSFNGTDYAEFYIQATGAGAKTVQGLASQTYFNAEPV